MANKLRHLGVEVDKDYSTSYEVLKSITEEDEWIYFLEDLEYVQQGHEDYSKEEFVDMCLKSNLEENDQCRKGIEAHLRF
ncbi:hypothetical protein [Rummeliibacillus sp. BSL5]